MYRAMSCLLASASILSACGSSAPPVDPTAEAPSTASSTTEATTTATPDIKGTYLLTGLYCATTKVTSTPPVDVVTAETIIINDTEMYIQDQLTICADHIYRHTETMSYTIFGSTLDHQPLETDYYGTSSPCPSVPKVYHPTGGQAGGPYSFDGVTLKLWTGTCSSTDMGDQYAVYTRQNHQYAFPSQ